jgi:hypothetical protein
MGNCYHCVACQRMFYENQLSFSHKGKIAGCATGLAAGTQTKNVWAALGAALLGAAIGAAIDSTISPKCPICGEALTLALNQILS